MPLTLFSHVGAQNAHIYLRLSKHTHFMHTHCLDPHLGGNIHGEDRVKCTVWNKYIKSTHFLIYFDKRICIFYIPKPNCEFLKVTHQISGLTCHAPLARACYTNTRIYSVNNMYLRISHHAKKVNMQGRCTRTFCGTWLMVDVDAVSFCKATAGQSILSSSSIARSCRERQRGAVPRPLDSTPGIQ